MLYYTIYIIISNNEVGKKGRENEKKMASLYLSNYVKYPRCSPRILIHFNVLQWPKRCLPIFTSTTRLFAFPRWFFFFQIYKFIHIPTTKQILFIFKNINFRFFFTFVCFFYCCVYSLFAFLRTSAKVVVDFFAAPFLYVLLLFSSQLCSN